MNTRREFISKIAGGIGAGALVGVPVVKAAHDPLAHDLAVRAFNRADVRKVAAGAIRYFTIQNPDGSTNYYQSKAGEVKRGWPLDVWRERQKTTEDSKS